MTGTGRRLARLGGKAVEESVREGLWYSLGYLQGWDDAVAEANERASRIVKEEEK